MGDLFKALTGGLSKFIFAWIVPSVITLGLFSLFVLPRVNDLYPFEEVIATSKGSPATATLIFSFFVLVLSMLFAYSSLPIYRLLEGYSLPKRLQARLIRRHLRAWHRLKWQEQRALDLDEVPAGLLKERLNAYPVTPDRMRATRLGNALTAMESFGVTRYGIDSQSLWYELQAVSPETVRRQTEEGRSPVDFFVSSMAHFFLFAVTCTALSLIKQDLSLLVLGAIALLLLPLNYNLAVRNVKDWAGAVRALVNLGRRPLADAVGLTMPARLTDEQEMWASFLWAIEELDTESVPVYDSYRLPPPPPSARATGRLSSRNVSRRPTHLR